MMPRSGKTGRLIQKPLERSPKFDAEGRLRRARRALSAACFLSFSSVDNRVGHITTKSFMRSAFYMSRTVFLRQRRACQ